MKLAIQENLLSEGSFLEKLKQAEKYGFEGIEVWGHNLSERKEEIKKALLKSKVTVSTICAGYRGSLLSAKKEERDTAVKDIKELLSIGGDLGAVGLIVVPIFGPPKIPDLSPWKSAKELEENLLCELLQIIGDKAQEAGCLCLLEPLNRYETHFLNTVEDAVRIVKKVKNSGIKIMADFFHMSIEEKSIEDAIKEGEDFIYHVHLADSNRLLPGYGHTDFAKGFCALEKIGYDKYMALECKVPGPPEEELPRCVKFLKSQMR